MSSRRHARRIETLEQLRKLKHEVAYATIYDAAYSVKDPRRMKIILGPTRTSTKPAREIRESVAHHLRDTFLPGLRTSDIYLTTEKGDRLAGDIRIRHKERLKWNLVIHPGQNQTDQDERIRLFRFILRNNFIPFNMFSRHGYRVM